MINKWNEDHSAALPAENHMVVITIYATGLKKKDDSYDNCECSNGNKDNSSGYS